MKEIIPWTNRERAALKEAFGLSIAIGFPLDSPIFGTQVPKVNEHIGFWRMGKELEECLKCRHMPRDFGVR